MTALRTTGAGAAPALLTGVLWAQGLFYLLTGVWPLVSLQTFEMVTGPKTDHWLVQTVGVLIAVIGLVLLVAAYRRHAPAEVAVLALGAALALAGVDVVFVSLRVIDPVYLLDTAAEGILVAWWAVGLLLARRAGPTRAGGAAWHGPGLAGGHVPRA